MAPNGNERNMLILKHLRQKKTAVNGRLLDRLVDEPTTNGLPVRAAGNAIMNA